MSSDRLATAEQAIKDFEAYYQDTLRDFDPNEIFPSEHQLDLVSPAFSREHKGNRGQRKRRPGVQKPRRYPVGGS